jgi:hypothetical protein
LVRKRFIGSIPIVGSIVFTVQILGMVVLGKI